MIVYLVEHLHVIDEDNENVKIIGIYSSQKLADEAIGRVRQKEGFKDSPDGFSIDPYKMD
ncbi:MAG: hypothetical protein IPH06_00615 [Alphaproteobacteria bacterium]|nr:hypothetical protein [Alphaproteobacteria bacterium]QQS56575.1 MAG: hypothetical protein IPN28_09865 [Alphaproteobacteria bacterium]